MLIWKINALIWFHCMNKRTNSLIEERQSAEGTHLLHVPLVSLLVRRKMVAVHYFVWPPALRLYQAGRLANSISGLL